VAKAHKVSDGFGATWKCQHGLTSEHCFLHVLRPGTAHCPCFESVKELVECIADKYGRERADCCEEAAYRYESTD